MGSRVFMYKIHQFNLLKFCQRTCIYILACLWILGLLLGIYTAVQSGDSFSLMMRGRDLTVSIFGLLLTVVLPFLLSAIAVYLSHPFLLLGIVFGKAFLFGYCCCGLLTVYGDAFWLIQPLLMFSDLLSLPFLMRFWLRSFRQPEQLRIRSCLLLLVIPVAIAVVDICIVSPFVTVLL